MKDFIADEDEDVSDDYRPRRMNDRSDDSQPRNKSKKQKKKLKMRLKRKRDK